MDSSTNARHLLSLTALSVLGLMTFDQIAGSDAIKSCVKKSACSCETESGLINLEPLAGEEEPGLDSNKDDEYKVYYYNPCYNIKLGILQSTAVALYQKDVHIWWSLGDNTNVNFTVSNATVTLTTWDKNSKMSNIRLECDTGASDPTFTYEGGDTVIVYNFVLTSRYCCPGFYLNSGLALSVGAIALILAACLCVGYLAGGIVYQTAVKKAHGRERIPNVDFWTSLPGLVKDGCLLTFTCGRRNSYRDL